MFLPSKPVYSFSFQRLDSLNLFALGPPLLTAEPMDVIGQTGESVSFLCIARAVPAVNSVLWMKNGNPIGSTNSHTSYEETIGDETRSILLVRSLSESDGGSTYRCRVTNSEGSVESSGGTLTVNRELNKQYTHGLK